MTKPIKLWCDFLETHIPDLCCCESCHVDHELGYCGWQESDERKGFVVIGCCKGTSAFNELTDEKLDLLLKEYRS